MKRLGKPLTLDRPKDSAIARRHRATLRALLGEGTEADWRVAREVLDSDAVQRATDEIRQREQER